MFKLLTIICSIFTFSAHALVCEGKVNYEDKDKTIVIKGTYIGESFSVVDDDGVLTLMSQNLAIISQSSKEGKIDAYVMAKAEKDRLIKSLGMYIDYYTGKRLSFKQAYASQTDPILKDQLQRSDDLSELTIERAKKAKSFLEEKKDKIKYLPQEWTDNINTLVKDINKAACMGIRFEYNVPGTDDYVKYCSPGPELSAGQMRGPKPNLFFRGGIPEFDYEKMAVPSYSLCNEGIKLDVEDPETGKPTPKLDSGAKGA